MAKDDEAKGGPVGETKQAVKNPSVRLVLIAGGVVLALGLGVLIWQRRMSGGSATPSAASAGTDTSGTAPGATFQTINNTTINPPGPPGAPGGSAGPTVVDLPVPSQRGWTPGPPGVGVTPRPPQRQPATPHPATVKRPTPTTHPGNTPRTPARHTSAKKRRGTHLLLGRLY